jgi:hypothetical protein
MVSEIDLSFGRLASDSVVVKVLCYRPEFAGPRPDKVNALYQFT